MSEQEREIEIVAGVIEGVIQKKPDTWQVEVKPESSQYTKKLWTKDAELVSSLTSKLGQHGAFVCGASYWTNQVGTEVRSLWIAGESDGSEVATPKATGSVATPDAAPHHAPLIAGDKDRAITRMACLKAAAECAGYAKVDASGGDIVPGVLEIAARFETWVMRDIDDVPF